jgi:hypothetical protein
VQAGGHMICFVFQSASGSHLEPASKEYQQ